VRMRDAQFDALRVAQTARLVCASLEERGELAHFEPSSRTVRSTDAAGYLWQYELGADGKLAAVRTPAGRLSRMHFDDQGRIEELTEPSGRHTEVPADEHGAPIRFVRDGQTLVSFSWNAERTACAAEFCDGSRAQLTTTAAGRPLRYANRLNQVTAFDFDAAGRLVELRDGLGQATRFECDDAGLPSATRHADGRVESVIRRSPNAVALAVGGEPLVEMTTDAGGRPLAVTYADGAAYGYAYDDASRLVSATGPNGGVDFQYREDGKLVRETSGKETFAFEYDARDQLAAIEYPDGPRAEFVYDSDKRLARVVWGAATFELAYAPGDRQRSVTTAALRTEFEFGAAGKPTRIAVSDPLRGALAFETTYQYDLEGRLLVKRDSAFGERRYAYDAEAELVGVADEHGQWREMFGYDAAGNRNVVSGLSVGLAAGNRLRAQGDLTCEYDARGNLVGLTSPTQAWRYDYDFKNQMVAAHGPHGTIEFKYDALGRRIEKNGADRRIRYVWCGELLTREVITVGEQESVRDYLYAPGTYEPLAQRVDGRVFYYHNDQLGTPQRLTDEQGRVVWEARYYAFGYAEVTVGAVENPLRLPGQYFDVETGLHYNRFRYYSPLLGRYVSVDPVGLLGGQNLYRYAGNDPINATDALGLFSWGALAAGVVTAVAVGVAAVVLAPAAVATLAAGVAIAGAAALGATIGLGLAEFQSIGHVCWPCFWKGAASAAPLALGAGLVIGAAMVLCPPLGLGLLAGSIVYGTYSMFADHYGWSGGKPFDEMTDAEKSRHVGELFGGTVAGLAGGVLGGLGAKAIRGPTTPVTGGEGAGDGDGTGDGSDENSGDEGSDDEGSDDDEGTDDDKPPPDPDQDTVNRCGPPQKPIFMRPGEGTRPASAQDARPGQPMTLDPNVSDRYLYVVQPDGTITYAPQSPQGSPTEIVKHTDLTEGGDARVSGELNYDPATDTWKMDGASGRYSTQQTPAGLVGNRTPDNVSAAVDLAKQTGGNQNIEPADQVFPH